MKNIAVFAGSFDPFTNGHLDVLKKALKDFDEIVVLVMRNPQKDPFFSIGERILIIREIIKDIPNVIVDTSQGYTVNYAHKHGCNTLIRGVRTEEDISHEKKLEEMNNSLRPSIRTVYYWTTLGLETVSSTRIKADFINKKDISKYVSSIVIASLVKKLRIESD